MISFLARLWKDRRGNALAIACAAMPMVVGCAGLATDTIQWTLWRRQLQRAADSAAIAGVYDRENASGATTNTSTAVCRDLALNLHTWMALQGTTPCTGTAGSYSTLSYPADASYETNQVTVTLKIQQPLPFSSLFMATAPLITANATAASIATGTPCALALNSTGTAMNYNGNATVNAPTCILYSDSSASNSASAGGSSAVTAKSIAAVGGIQQSNNWNVTQYIPYSPTLPDPLANVTPDPNAMHCTGAALTDSTDFSSLGNTNCFSAISLNPNRTINVPSSMSIIYVNGGNVDLKGTFNCTCTVVLTNQSQSANAMIGTWSSNAQANNNITAPQTGPYANIAVYQDRRAIGNTDQINGGASNQIQGAVYFPKDTLRINGTGTAVSLCAMWIANNISFLGTSSIAISSPDDTVCSGKEPGGSPVKMVRLVA
ncbi:MAG TPA: pilus assembly protein TadG-related protein [Sphingomicrobium sp.]|nr:pilus assembly protein TadG-related protein [Sphingomicrobium sp.]